ncbi:deoxyribonucleotide triphosphate pyrophosphatase [Escherichia coli]|uniref:Deoxyribonucleotide triphosphate pyrophosphatase n=1 Tax=Escherichia coli TaxID=562 RepID=A0A2X1KBQ3_ECOLX|nr:deoxyribonucleotide triphosphate pyrophosphatase [Escherichia coli]
MQKVVLATGNVGKVRELASLLSDFGLDIVAQTDLGVDSAEETGLTFIENAILKARHAAKVTGFTGNCRRLWSGGRCAWRRAGHLLRALFR